MELKNLSNKLISISRAPLDEEHRLAAHEIILILDGKHIDYESIRRKKFPSLTTCFEYCRSSVSDNKLTDRDEHMIGSLWAFIEKEIKNGK